MEDIDDLVEDRSGETFSDCDCKGETKKTKRVLFIGNSFTFYNDMPDMIRQLAECTGYPSHWRKEPTGTF